MNRDPYHLTKRRECLGCGPFWDEENDEPMPGFEEAEESLSNDETCPVCGEEAEKNHLHWQEVTEMLERKMEARRREQ